MMIMMMVMMMMMMKSVCEVMAGDPLPAGAPSAPQPNLTQSPTCGDHHSIMIISNPLRTLMRMMMSLIQLMLIMTMMRQSAKPLMKVRFPCNSVKANTGNSILRKDGKGGNGERGGKLKFLRLNHSVISYPIKVLELSPKFYSDNHWKIES